MSYEKMNVLLDLAEKQNIELRTVSEFAKFVKEL